MSEATYRVCWGAFEAWACSVMEGLGAVRLATLGVVYRRAYSLGVTIPCFELSASFASRYGLTAAPGISAAAAAARPARLAAARPDAAAMARAAGVSEEVMATALNNAFDALGEALGSGARVHVRIAGLGDVVGGARTVGVEFLQTAGDVVAPPMTATRAPGPPHALALSAVAAARGGPAGGTIAIDSLSPRPPTEGSADARRRGGRGRRPGRGGGPAHPDPLEDGSDIIRSEPGTRSARPPTIVQAPGDVGYTGPRLFPPEEYPPVLDAFSHTLAAPFARDTTPQSLPHRIGSLYGSRDAAGLTLSARTHAVVRAPKEDELRDAVPMSPRGGAAQGSPRRGPGASRSLSPRRGDGPPPSTYVILNYRIVDPTVPPAAAAATGVSDPAAVPLTPRDPSASAFGVGGDGSGSAYTVGATAAAPDAPASAAPASPWRRTWHFEKDFALRAGDPDFVAPPPVAAPPLPTPFDVAIAGPRGGVIIDRVGRKPAAGEPVYPPDIWRVSGARARRRSVAPVVPRTPTRARRTRSRALPSLHR